MTRVSVTDVGECARYFSKAVLGHLHRTMAVKEWIKVQQGGSSLERALVAFDMFVIQESEGDFDTVRRPGIWRRDVVILTCLCLACKAT